MTKDEERKNPDPNVIHPIKGYDKEIYVKKLLQLCCNLTFLRQSQAISSKIKKSPKATV